MVLVVFQDSPAAVKKSRFTRSDTKKPACDSRSMISCPTAETSPAFFAISNTPNKPTTFRPRASAMAQSQFFIHQQVLGTSFFSQDNSLRFPSVKLTAQHLRHLLVLNRLDVEKIWNSRMKPQQFILDGRGNQHTTEECPKDTGLSDLKQRGDGRSIADDQHYFPHR